ncbi:hypothetical protein OnM2_059034 [Erysiphe neolycopersici]|uniref:CFEM domain-containing protein n=1 Tax=Erysiphe neolycopersici TaxID=212602 RepID=A0A420HQ08_9PEZI|nr:hypothetical protein OnM2_059034 [Erysiphe neolycopersici]
MMFNEIILFLFFLVQASAGLSHLETPDKPPLCAVQCGAMTRTKFRRKCSLTNPSCICSFIDSYTLCAVGRCSGHDRAAAIKTPISFFVPESMLVSDDDFEPICLHGENIVDSSAKEGEEKEPENKFKSTFSSTTTTFEGDGIVITLDHNGRVIAKVEDEEPVQLNSHFKPIIEKRKGSGSGGGGGGHSNGGRSGSSLGVGSTAGVAVDSAARLGAGSRPNGSGTYKNDATSIWKLMVSWHKFLWIGLTITVFGLL